MKVKQESRRESKAQFMVRLVEDYTKANGRLPRTFIVNPEDIWDAGDTGAAIRGASIYFNIPIGADAAQKTGRVILPLPGAME